MKTSGARFRRMNLFIGPFHGGGDIRFAAKETSSMTLDDFCVSTAKFSDLP